MQANRTLLESILSDYYANATKAQADIFVNCVANMVKAIYNTNIEIVNTNIVYALADVVALHLIEEDLLFKSPLDEADLLDSDL